MNYHRRNTNWMHALPKWAQHAFWSRYWKLEQWLRGGVL